MVTREEVFRVIESLECEGIPFNVKAAEILRQTWDERVRFECALIREKYELLIERLWEHGIGIASLDEIKAYTIAIAKGDIKPDEGEPKLWFSSIEAMVEALQKCYSGPPSEDS